MRSNSLPPQTEREYSFGPFRFIPAQQLLLDGTAPLRLGSRALAILHVLLERPGELVSKQEIMLRVWPDTVVEDSNLKVHIAALRRALGEQKDDNNYIVTVSGRGYRFAAAVSSVAASLPRPVTGPRTAAGAGRARAGTAGDPAAAGAATAADLDAGAGADFDDGAGFNRNADAELNASAGKLPQAQEHARQLNLPCPTTRMIGRSATVANMLQTLARHRLVSIVGPGGIGKTTVALSVAEEFARQSGMDICFVDLSPLNEGRFAAVTVATALGLTIHSGDGTPAVVANLRERRLLLVLDSCEHVIDAAATLIDRILAGAPQVVLLTTSREPLRTTGEHVHRLAPLPYPEQGQEINAAAALEYPSIQLFAQRASQSVEGYRISDGDAPAVAEICRRLEGNALAIELAATRIDAFGARELAARLDDRFQLLKRGRRGAHERHSTLAAALDWSYDFLPVSEQALLRCLSVFAGAFTLDSALALCAGAPAEANDIMEGMANLVAKSLLAADVGGVDVTYRLLDTTKAYAREKLEQYGELEAMRRRHAECFCQMFQQAASEWDAHPTEEWLAHYARRLDDVRSALSWSFAPDGEPQLGVALTIAAIPLWMYLSLLNECRECVERALQAGGPDPRQEMKLQAALAATILYTRGPVVAMKSAWTRSLQLADELQHSECQLRALWGLAVYHSYVGNHKETRALAERFRVIAGSAADRPALYSVDRLVGTALHYGGEQAAARRELERMLAHYVTPQHCIHVARYQVDQRSAALGTLANVLWLQGFADQAVETVAAAMQAAREAEHIPSLMTTFTQSAFPVLLAVGDHAGAAALLDELSLHLDKHALPIWSTLQHCLRALLKVHNGDVYSIHLLHDDLDELRRTGFHLRFNSYLGVLATALGNNGRQDEALSLIGDALACCEAGMERWCHAELLRIKGSLLEGSDVLAAEEHYQQSLAIARQQGALSWELRTASSLAQLKARQGARCEGEELLEAVYRKFSEGLATPDLRRAKALVDGRDPNRPRILIH